MAFYVNRFKVVCYGDLTRIMFEDCIEDTEGIIQTQVVMRTKDAKALCNLVIRLIEEKKA